MPICTPKGASFVSTCPTTCNAEVGLVVPIPTLPSLSHINAGFSITGLAAHSAFTDDAPAIPA